MLRVEIIKDYMEHYKIDSKVISFEDVAKILVKCKILDKRTKRYNIVGFNYEELVYNELMDLKVGICFPFFQLLEYSLYFEQEDKKLEMIEPIYQAMSFLINIINNTSQKRKKCRYKNVIKTIIKYESDFYENKLINNNEREKEIVKLRFGLSGNTEKTQKEVADMLGISQSYISRLEKKIINRLKKEINKMI